MPGLGPIGGKSIGGSMFLNFLKVAVAYLKGLYIIGTPFAGLTSNTTLLEGVYEVDSDYQGTYEVEPDLLGEYKVSTSFQGVTGK